MLSLSGLEMVLRLLNLCVALRAGVLDVGVILASLVTGMAVLFPSLVGGGGGGREQQQRLEPRRFVDQRP
ncbi:hypothetical protein BV22DRAFT_1032468 [Leucogyrophana mollusca]|uniref:Uncharacterized protein n=1 Tax=Leucogyrophana mollusca TaxID=85980 RepID=A0ACB8BM71_9AGAM|nr:hypothetical protein BV22DRAFT_1032468 [Leucogyrophana mollusca]